ncbi:MAG: flagellar hook-associated protein 3 [Rhodoferax sp.]|nr:flagellar hook-associated protein 3 [Rhodoferax sp.]
MRMSTANLYEKSLQNLYTRQSDLASQQERLTSGKRINRASDDPTAVAQAERAHTRLGRIASDQRALEVQRNAISLAESTLGDAAGVMQRLRELTVQAGNGSLNASNRAVITQEMRGLREQLLALANTRDANANPLFGGLGSAGAPFVDTGAGVVFNGIAGQAAAGEFSVPGVMDGQAVWMDVASGNGSFTSALGGTNTGSLWTDTGQVTNPSALTGNQYTITFNVTGSTTTYNVVNTTTATPVATAVPYVDGQAIQFDGLSLVPHGAPANGDTVQVSPSATTDVFSVIDQAVAGIGQASAPLRNQASTLALAQLDSALARLQAARSQAGQWMGRADTIQTAQEGRTVQLEADRSRAEDLDMVQGISDFTKFQTGYQAALQSYAQVQQLSLFNFIKG